jgi:hypothetical protein
VAMPMHKFLTFRVSTVALLTLVAALLCSFTLAADDSRNRTAHKIEIPAGTILPASLNNGLSSKKAKSGQPVAARIMQDVPLPNDGKVPAGAKLLGTVTSVEPASTNGGGTISFRFDRLKTNGHEYSLTTNLRAIAGPVDVQFAQTPEVSPGFGTPYRWATTRQIGGDEVFGEGGPVTDRESNHVGKGVFGGVLVHVRAQPGSGCRGALDPEDRLQALWVFSSDACGVYGIEHVAIADAGRTDPGGVITLAAEDHHDVQVRAGTGMLLRVDR